MKLPFQRLLYVAPKDATSEFLIAASGASLSVFDAVNGTRLSKWPQWQVNDPEGRPLKRRKTGEAEEAAVSSAAAQSPTSNVETANETSKSVPNRASFVTSLVGTSDGQYIVASTAEDKLLYVFKLHRDGMLSQVSKRYDQTRELVDTVLMFPKSDGQAAFCHHIDAR